MSVQAMTTGTDSQTLLILEQACAWHRRLESPQATAADRSRFQDWLAADPRHAALYDQAAGVLFALDDVGKDDLDPSLLKPTLSERFVAMRTRIANAGSRPAWAIASGAVAALMLIAVLLRPFSPAVPGEVFTTGIGETKTVTLADGSQVTLGPVSELEAAYSAKSRQVYLKTGSAFLIVAKEPERPFSVDADAMTATVVGTRFDVRTGAGVVRVGVAEGAVEVTYPFTIFGLKTPIHEKQPLAAGQQIAANADTGLMLPTSVHPASVGAWRENRLVYKEATLAELVAEVSRYSAIPIAFAEQASTLKRVTVTGAFDANDIDGLLATLSDHLPLRVDRTDPGVVRLRPSRR